ncbi:hypothetical protein Taro_021091 [Colocasia esculenta]|uniref:RNase H type-1 domain-containing protein n=1 Tax=Colocasia esculenta TaxID=4460 RepID=A0A843V780_COLES|nr:hypothetical protein [Colocasia esculenta]
MWLSTASEKQKNWCSGKAHLSTAKEGAVDSYCFTEEIWFWMRGSVDSWWSGYRQVLGILEAVRKRPREKLWQSCWVWISRVQGRGLELKRMQLWQICCVAGDGRMAEAVCGGPCEAQGALVLSCGADGARAKRSWGAGGGADLRSAGGGSWQAGEAEQLCAAPGGGVLRGSNGAELDWCAAELDWCADRAELVQRNSPGGMGAYKRTPRNRSRGLPEIGGFFLSSASEESRSYEDASGQLINKHKSSFYVPTNATDSLIQKIGKTNGFTRAKLPIKYLGVSIYSGRQKPTHFAHIISRTVTKLQGWKKDLLSSGGRLILIQHILSALPIYSMNAMLIPTTVVRAFHQILANFFWGSYEGSPKRHWKSWHTIAQPKESGGLGVLNLHHMQTAFRTKMLWRALTTESIWAKFFRGKHPYNCHHSEAHFPFMLAADRKLWQQAAHIIHNNHRIISMDNSPTTYFWHDVWTGEKPLKDFIPEDTWNSMPGKDCTIQQAFNNPTSIQLQTAIQHCPYHLLSQFLITHNTKDTWIWCLTTNGNFSTKSVRSLLAPENSLQWAALWSPYIPLKWSIFLWRLMLNIIPVDETVKEKGVPLASKCSCCTQAQEDNALHLFFRSNIANQIWSELSHLLHFRNMESYGRFGVAGTDLDCKARKCRPHILSIDPCYPSEQYAFLQVPEHPTNLLNVDGAFKITSGEAGGGGILRDHEGNMCWAFTQKYYGLNSSLATEALALRDGLSICCSKGVTEVLVETDSLNLLQIVTKKISCPWDFTCIMQHIVAKTQLLEAKITHTPREANRVVDCLASSAASYPHFLIWDCWADLPTIVKEPYQFDKVGNLGGGAEEAKGKALAELLGVDLPCTGERPGAEEDAVVAYLLHDWRWKNGRGCVRRARVKHKELWCAAVGRMEPVRRGAGALEAVRTCAALEADRAGAAEARAQQMQHLAAGLGWGVRGSVGGKLAKQSSCAQRLEAVC